jgi:choline dehydrogenase-like flavoprotein
VTDFEFGRYAPPGRFGRAAPALVPDTALEIEHELLGCSLEFDRPAADDPLVDQLSTPDRTFTHYRLVARSEMLPNASNRVEIMADESRSGLYRVSARCVLDAGDLRNIEHTIRLLGETLIRLNRGRVRVNNDAIYRDVTGGGHIMGTTRMGHSASSSVVDEQCRVHGYRNLFVAGSSVFPTAGYANPTFTIVALAVRLADYIAGASS